MDHESQLARLSALCDHEGRAIPVRVSTCLGICFKANVVVVQPSSRGRAAGGRPVWLGDFTEERLIQDLDDWVFAGGPGAAPLPESLAPHVTDKDAKKPKKLKKPKKHAKDAKRKKERKKEKKRKGVEVAQRDAASGGKHKKHKKR